MSSPTDGMILASRVQSNLDWLAHCENLFRNECRLNGAFARQARKNRRASLRTVASAMGISAMMLCHLERGNRNWTSDTLAKWAKAIDALEPKTTP